MQIFKNIVEKLSFALHVDRQDSPSLKSKKAQKAINAIGSTQLQAEQITYVDQRVVRQGITAEEAVEIVRSVIRQEWSEFTDEARILFESRISNFQERIIDKLIELPEEERQKLVEPDTQLAIREAVLISGRKQDQDLREMLAELVIKRIRNDESGREDLKNIVYNEAIITLGRLTIDQLKIITLCYLLSYTIEEDIISWRSFNEYINSSLIPFTDFKDTDAEYQHVEYSGCGRILRSSWVLIEALRNRYPFLFLREVSKEEIEKLDVPNEVKEEIVSYSDEEGRYMWRFRNRIELEEFLQREDIDEDMGMEIQGFVNLHLKSGKEIEQMINENTDSGGRFIEIFEKSQIMHMDLTSVGIALAATFYEQITGNKMDIELWIY